MEQLIEEYKNLPKQGTEEWLNNKKYKIKHKNNKKAR